MPDNEILINQIIETDNIKGTMYYQFLENAIKMGDRTRFSLIDFPAVFLQVNKFEKDKIKDYSIYNLLSPTLYRINELVISNNDFELFKYEIDDFTRFQVLKPPIKILNDIEQEFFRLLNTFHLNKFKIKFDEEIETKIEYLKFIVEYKLLRDLKCYNTIVEELESFESQILIKLDEFKNKGKLKSIFSQEVDIDDEKVYEDIIKDVEKSKKEVMQILSGSENRLWVGIKQELYEFKLNALVYRTFFVIGAYLIFSKRYKDINGVNYIKELWYHINPVRQDVGYMMANVPVDFNSYWLISLFMFGCKGNESWIRLPWREFDDFHSAKQYVIQYFLLCLTRSGNIDIFPNLDQIRKFSLNKETYKLENWYDLAKRFSFKQSELMDNIDILINESDDWNILLSYVKDGKKIDANDVLIDTKNRIKQLMSRIDEILIEIEKLLPMDPEKIQKARDAISESYCKNSILPEIFNSREYDEKIDKGKKFIQIGFRPLVDKHCFIKSNFVYCEAIWQDMGFTIASNELNHLNDVIFKNKNIQSSQTIQTDADEIYKEIISAVEIINEKHNPDLLIIPFEISSQLFQQSINKESLLYNKILYDGYESLLVNDLKLRIIYSNNFNKISVLDSQSVSWIYKPDLETKKRISVIIDEYKDDVSKVDVTAKTVVKVKITKPEASRILKFSSNDDQS
jgi:hypothetical protein